MKEVRNNPLQAYEGESIVDFYKQAVIAEGKTLFGVQQADLAEQFFRASQPVMTLVQPVQNGMQFRFEIESGVYGLPICQYVTIDRSNVISFRSDGFRWFLPGDSLFLTLDAVLKFIDTLPTEALLDQVNLMAKAVRAQHKALDIARARVAQKVCPFTHGDIVTDGAKQWRVDRILFDEFPPYYRLDGSKLKKDGQPGVKSTRIYSIQQHLRKVEGKETQPSLGET